MKRATRWSLLLLIVLDAAVRCAVIFHPLSAIDHLTLLDDSYLSLTIARNIAHGLGPWYGLGFTNGFQPLYVFLMVPAYWIWPADPLPPIRFALLLLTLFDLAALVILFRWIRRRTGSVSVAFVAGLAWALNPYLIRTTLNGLETVIALCFTLATFAFLDGLLTRLQSGEVPRARAWRELGALLGLLIFTRIDGTIVAGLVGLCSIVELRRHGRSAWQTFGALVQVAWPAATISLPWMLYFWHYTRSLFPVSGRAVRFLSLAAVHHHPTFANFYSRVLGDAGTAILESQGLLIVAIVTLTIAALLLRGRALRASFQLERDLPMLLLLLVHTYVLFFAYTTIIYGSWYFARYFAPITVAVLVLFGTMLDQTVKGVQTPRLRSLAVLAVAILIAGGSIAQPRFRALYAATGTDDTGPMSVGLWAKSRFPSGTIIGSAQSGALGYFAPDLTVVNLDGVVNAACFRSLEQFRNLAYIRASKIRYIVNWEAHTRLIQEHSRTFRSGSLRFLGWIPGVRSLGASWGLWEVAPQQRSGVP